MNWIIKEAEKADWRKNRIILENPESVKELDEILIDEFYSVITKTLAKTDLPYYPANKNDVDIDSDWAQDGLGRKMLFFLYDHVNYPILRGDITVSKTGYMFERTFSLGLPKDTNPDFMFRILSDPNFSGVPPTLDIYESEVNPEWNVYFHIKISSGTGYDFGPYNLYNTAFELVEETIKDSVEMYEASMIEGFQTMEEVKKFLAIAHKCFKS